MKYLVETAYAEACLAMVTAAVVADMLTGCDDIRGVVGAMPVASEEDSLAPVVEVRAVEAGESS